MKFIINIPVLVFVLTLPAICAMAIALAEEPPPEAPEQFPIRTGYDPNWNDDQRAYAVLIWWNWMKLRKGNSDMSNFPSLNPESETAPGVCRSRIDGKRPYRFVEYWAGSGLYESEQYMSDYFENNRDATGEADCKRR